jgi:hypothetical protein
MNFHDALKEAARFAKSPTPGFHQIVAVSISTGQAGWIGPPTRESVGSSVASYARGQLSYFELGIFGKYKLIPERLATPSKQGIPYLFDNRKDFWPTKPVPFGQLPTQGVIQPFDAKSADSLGISISAIGTDVTAYFTLRTWDNAKFSVELKPFGGVLVGEGPAIGNTAGTSIAVYTVSFDIGYTYLG